MHRSRTGFTLIELLLVMVVIGILATIAAPRFTSARERAHFKAMISDLRNLSTHQEIYFARADAFVYASTVTLLSATQSPGVTLHLAGATNQGWQATATHAALGPTKACGIFFGTPSTYPPPYVSVSGVVRCTNE